MSSPTLASDEYVTEEVCLKMTGCRLNIDTGECPECVIKRRKVVHTHEETSVKEKPVVKATPKKKSTVKRKWKCIIKPCDWIDENGNLKS